MSVSELETKAEKQRREMKEIADYNAEYARIQWDAYAKQGFTEWQIIALIRDCEWE